MRRPWWQLDVGELILLALGAGAGVTWALLALLIWEQWPLPAAALPARTVQLVALWPVWSAFSVGSALYQAGLILDVPLLLFASGIATGLMVGMLSIVFLRWRS